RREREVDLLWLRVVIAMPSGAKVLEERGPRELGLTGEEDVGVRSAAFRAERGIGAADGDQLPPLVKHPRELDHPAPLAHVARDADQVAGHVEVDRLYGLVADHHLDVRRRQGGERGRRQVRDVSGLARDVGGFREAPEARLETRVHEIHAHGVSLRYVASPPSSCTTAPVMY